MKKTFQLFLFASLLLLGSATAWAQTSGSCGTNVTWSLSSGTLTISGTGAMADYSAFTATPWYANESAVSTIIIKEDVTAIGTYAFYDFTNLKTVIFKGTTCPTLNGKKVTIPPTISYYVYPFGTKEGLTVYYPSGGTGYNGDSHFPSGTTYVPINYIAGTDASWTLSDSNRTLTIEGGGSLSLTGSAPWASQASAIRRIIFKGNYTSVNFATFGCSNLQCVIYEDSTAPTMSDLSSTVDVYSITTPGEIYGAIANTDIFWILAAKTLTIYGTGAIPNYTSSTNAPWISRRLIENLIIKPGITAIGDYAFADVTDLLTVSLPNNLRSIGAYAFYRAGSTLASGKTITIPSSVVSMGDYAFKGHSFDEIVYLSRLVPTNQFELSSTSTAVVEVITTTQAAAYFKLDPTHYRIVGGTVGTNDNITWRYGAFTLTFTGTGAMPNYSSVKALPWYDCRQTTQSVVIGEGITSVGNSSFQDFINVTNVSLPTSLTQVGDWAFADCSSLSELALPTSLTQVGDWAFADCSSLSELVLPTSLTQVGDWAFAGCSSVSELTIPASLTTIGTSAFIRHNLSKLIYLPQNAPATTDAFGYNERTCHVTASNDNVIQYFKELGYILDNGVLGSWRVEGKTLYVNNSWQIYNKSWESSISRDLIERIVIGEGVETIPAELFMNYTGLTELILNGGTIIGSKAFAYCTSLERIYFGAKVKSFEYSKQQKGYTTVENFQFVDHTYLEYYGPFHGCTHISVVDVESLEAYCAIQGLQYLSMVDYSDFNLGWWPSEPIYHSYALHINGQEPEDGKVAIPFGAHISAGAFTYVNNVDYIVLPTYYQFNDGEAIGGCVKTIESTSRIPMEQWQYVDYIGEDAADRSTMTLIVPSGCAEAYRSARVWKEFGTIIEKEVLTATLSEDELEGAYGTVFPALTVTTPSGETNVSWSSSDPNVATVDADGVVTITAQPYTGTGNYKPQVAVITAKILSSGDYKDVEATCLVKAIPEAVLTDGATYANQTEAEFSKITYTRHFKNTSWQAWYVPFDVVLDEDLLEEYDFSRIEGVLLDGEEWCIGILPLHSGETVKACVPYLVRAKVADDADTDHVLTLNETTLYASTNGNFTITSASDEFKFTGIFAPKTSTAEDIGWYGVSTSGGFTKITKVGTKLGANRFFLTVTERADNPYATNHAASSNLIRIREIGDATSLETFVEEVPTDAIFDLRGNKVDYPTESGIYIVNGKKIYLK